MAMNQKDLEKKWAEIVKKCEKDQVFKQRLLQNPKQVFKDHGLEVPAGITLKILESTKDTHYLILPESRMARDLSDSELLKISGGAGALQVVVAGKQWC